MNAIGTVFEAVQAGDVEGLKQLIADDPKLAAARNDHGLSILLHARHHWRMEMVDILLEADPPLDIFEAAALGRDDRTRELLDEDPSLVDAWSVDGFTPLHLAAYFGQSEAVRTLLARGADATVPSRNPMALTPLHSAAASGSHEICELLLEHGAEVNARQQGGWTPLFCAAARGDVAMTQLFLDHGADASLTQAEGKTPCDLAAERGHHKVVQLLTSFEASRGAA
ncbi:MAG TPA: ankyrin repeat domain-containing protein [Longimicrobiales bacterium]